MAQSQQPDSIVDLLVGARAEPPRMSAETELPTLFGPIKGRENPLIAEQLDEMKPSRQVRLVSFTKTFTLWRPWEKCERCKRMLADGEITLPDIGDWTCPHVQVVDYKDTKDKTLRGDGLKEFEEHFQLHDGTRCVQFSWLETDPEFIEEMKKKTELDRVYPPNPEKAFAQKEETPEDEPPKDELPDQKETPASEDS